MTFYKILAISLPPARNHAHHAADSPGQTTGRSGTGGPNCSHNTSETKEFLNFKEYAKVKNFAVTKAYCRKQKI